MGMKCSCSDLRLLHAPLHGGLVRRARGNRLPALREDVAQPRRRRRRRRAPAALCFHDILCRPPAHAQGSCRPRRERRVATAQHSDAAFQADEFGRHRHKPPHQAPQGVHSTTMLTLNSRSCYF